MPPGNVCEKDDWMGSKLKKKKERKREISKSPMYRQEMEKTTYKYSFYDI